MDTVQILKEARALIADEKNWTQKEMARDSFGLPVDPSHESAACYCSIGALLKASGGYDGEHFWLARREFYRGEGKVDSIARFNDHHVHQEVLALFDRAIARAESEAA